MPRVKGLTDMLICNRCKRKITGGRWVLPKEGGVETVCTQCKEAPKLPPKILAAIDARE